MTTKKSKKPAIEAATGIQSIKVRQITAPPRLVKINIVDKLPDLDADRPPTKKRLAQKGKVPASPEGDAKHGQAYRLRQAEALIREIEHLVELDRQGHL